MDRSPSGINDIVDRQVQRWNSARRRRHEDKHLVPILPCITISRQFGALGSALGTSLARELGFTCWDQELVHAISQSSGMDEQVLASVDEQTRNAIDLFIDGLLRGRTYSGGEYLSQLGRLIQTISAHGSAIIVGRGGQFLLSPSDALHVRAVSPIGPRIRGVARRRGISEAAAKDVVEKGEKERQAFIAKHYGRDVTDPTAYDLMINVESMTVDQAVAVVKTAYEQRFGNMAPKRVEAASLPPLVKPVPIDD
ncbi:MAG: cytidylate kinase-like family protein [Myxococcota bacterium]|nr:cytidylate kinase-like family protein [Myxococcota bacterium]